MIESPSHFLPDIDGDKLIDTKPSLRGSITGTYKQHSLSILSCHHACCWLYAFKDGKACRISENCYPYQ